MGVVMEAIERKSLFKSKAVRLLFIVAIAFLAGYAVRHWKTARETPIQQQKWTCSMDPQIIRERFGKCPICGMDLIPLMVHSADTEAISGQLTVSPEAAKLMEIETSVVERKFVAAEVRMVGKVDFDETRLKHITAWVSGRIDRLFVDFTGIRVIKGDHMVEFYSPQLISAQAEYIQAVKAVDGIKEESSELIKRTTKATVEAAKGKLRLLGLSDEQIEDVKKSGIASDHITINAPVGGIVIEKHVSEGMYVDTGTRIYTIADLSQVWVELDAYESDLEWVRYGQEVEFTTVAYPGQVFTGKISFISPTLDPRTRTVKLRINVPNQDEMLKPEMFVHAVVRSKVALGGLVMDPDMAGKWICPMHPSVVKDTASQCDICGMNLVTTESLGYVKATLPEQAPLVIPATAPLITGKRAVVYVRLADPNKPTFEGREVTLGPRAGDYYIVEQGLAEGDVVVTKGNFKIDSALQIEAKPSMMNPQGQPDMPIPSGHRH